ncbi:MAG: aminopeptidase P family protein [Ruminococcus sp.]|nr:aminopeptidase P family protein [Ruminococcus sp.]
MTNIEKLMQCIPKGSDCAIITSDINRRYFSGMKSSAGVVLCFKDIAYLVIDFRYIEKARKTVTDCEVILQESNSIQQIYRILKEHNVNRVSVESHCITIERLKAYQNAFLNIEFDYSNELSRNIFNIRTRKNPKEVEKIKFAQKIADDAFKHILKYIKVGVTEKDIALELDYYMLKHGAEALSFDTIALAGKNTSMPHGVPSDYEVHNGDFVLMDYGSIVDGYHSDMTRTICVGTPTKKMCEVYSIVLKAQQCALDNIKTGITGSVGDSFARNVIQNYGYGEYFGHSLGHGVGMEIHEYPVMAQNNDEMLVDGSIVTVEPGIYIPNEFGVRIEDFIYLQDSGIENLTKSPKDLICI